MIHFDLSGEESAGAAVKGSKSDQLTLLMMFSVQVRNFLPPQSAEPEIFLLEQAGSYSGTYGAKNGRPGGARQGALSGNFSNYDQSVTN